MWRRRTRNGSFGYFLSLPLLLCLLLRARGGGAANANTCSKQPKKVTKAKKASKKTTKKTASPSSLWFQCNPDTHNLEYNHNHHNRHHNDLIINDQPPWRYPYPRLLAGLTQFPLGANYSLALPTSMRRAMELGWRPQISVGDSDSVSAFCTWIHPEATRFELAFLDESLVSVKVLGQPPPTGTCSHQYFGDDTGIQLVFQNGWGVADGVYQVVSLSLDSDHDDTTKGIRILRYPRNVNEATAPYSKAHSHIFHQDVWKRGSCVPAMGGYHYYSLPWSESKPVVPIYDTFGSGHLTAAVLALRYDNFDDRRIRGFDADGRLAMGIPFHCDFNNCNADHCVEAFSEMHKDWLLNLENDNDLLQTLALTPVHLFWGVDPSDMDTWSSCGPHLECPPPSMHAPCSCCENAAKSHPRTNCPRPWPPIYDTPSPP